MSNKNENLNNIGISTSHRTDVISGGFLNFETANKIIQPLEMRWEPKKDITTYELAKCLPYLLSSRAPYEYEIDKTEDFFRHFEIIDHNS